MKRIYTGPSLIARAIVAELNDIGIAPIERNDMQSSALAGFGSAIPDQLQLFVREDQENKARLVVEKFAAP